MHALYSTCGDCDDSVIIWNVIDRRENNVIGGIYNNTGWVFSSISCWSEPCSTQWCLFQCSRFPCHCLHYFSVFYIEGMKHILIVCVSCIHNCLFWFTLIMYYYSFAAKWSEDFLHCLGDFGSSVAYHINISVCVGWREAPLAWVPQHRILCEAGSHTVEVHTSGICLI